LSHQAYIVDTRTVRQCRSAQRYALSSRSGNGDTGCIRFTCNTPAAYAAFQCVASTGWIRSRFTPFA